MSLQPLDDTKLVRQFRQILLWPLQLVPIREGAQIQRHWELLEQEGAGSPWGQVRDAFSCAPGDFQLRHYSEFVTFLPYVRRFLYGDAKGAGVTGRSESPIRVFRRSDVAGVRMTYPDLAEPLAFDVVHIDLCFFYDIDVVILVVEIAATDVSLSRVQETIFRFGRAYPTYWAADGHGGHCLERAEWLAADGSVLAVSNYEQRDQYLSHVGQHHAPRFASHWEFLMKPLVPDHSDEKGLIRYRQVESSRMPLLSYVAMDDAREPFFVNRDGGLLGQFRHQYFLLLLIPHLHKAALLMLSDRMADALNRLDIRDAVSVKQFKRTIRQLSCA